jgi:hypothetical protein
VGGFDLTTNGLNVNYTIFKVLLICVSLICDAYSLVNAYRVVPSVQALSTSSMYFCDTVLTVVWLPYELEGYILGMCHPNRPNLPSGYVHTFLKYVNNT